MFRKTERTFTAENQSKNNKIFKLMQPNEFNQPNPTRLYANLDSRDFVNYSFEPRLGSTRLSNTFDLEATRQPDPKNGSSR